MAAKKKPPAEAPKPPPTLETLLTSPLGFRLETATPVQRAVCRAIEGRPLDDLASDPNVVTALGGPEAVAALPSVRPREVYYVAGIRGAKSLTIAAAAVLATQIVDLSPVGIGDIVRVSILSLSKSTARAVYSHIHSHVMASPPLKALLVDEPTADTITLRHPSGKPIEIQVVAGAKAGGSLVAVWSAGVIFDEAPRMAGEENVVNFDDARAAVLGRLLPNAQLFAVGSPWASEGPVHDVVQRHFGNPSPEYLVIRAPAPVLNPVWWTPERVAAFRKDNPEMARTDIDAEFGLSAGSSFFVDSDFELLFRDDAPVSVEPGDKVAAAVDLGFVRNSATIAILSERASVGSVAHLDEQRPEPTRALVPSQVCGSFAADLQGRHCGMAVADGHYRETLREHTDPVGVSLYESCGPGERFLALRAAIRSGQLRCNPALPHAQRLRPQLAQVRPRLAPGGVLSVVLPEAADGSHCDLADVVARAVWGWKRYGGSIVPAREVDDPMVREEIEMLRRRDACLQKKEKTPWYRRFH